MILAQLMSFAAGKLVISTSDGDMKVSPVNISI